MELTTPVQVNCGRLRSSRQRIFLFALRSLPQWLPYWRSSSIRPGWQRTKADVVVSGRILRSSLAHRGRPTKPHFCNGGRRILCSVYDIHVTREKHGPNHTHTRTRAHAHTRPPVRANKCTRKHTRKNLCMQIHTHAYLHRNSYVFNRSDLSTKMIGTVASWAWTRYR